MTDYIKRSDASRAMAQYMMDTALIDNPEASDRIEEWEGNIAAPVMSTVKAADVRENITAHKVIGGGEHDGATCWIECSRCGKTVDVNDKYCSECGARFVP